MENNFSIIGTGKAIFEAWFLVKSILGSTILAGGRNPHFKSDYIQLDALLKKIDPVCQKCGLGIMMFPTGTGLITILFHKESGQYIQSYYELILDKQNPQGVGSALTYAKRQTLQAMFGLSAGPEEDDDGEEASQEEQKFEEENPVQGKVSSANAYQIAKVGLQEINSLEGLEIWKDAQPPIIKRNRSVRELVNGKTAELKLAV
jgi:hypothetical protein